MRTVSANRAAVARTNCPVPEVTGLTGDREGKVEQALGDQLAAQVAYRDWVRGVASQQQRQSTQQRRKREEQQPRKQADHTAKRARLGLRWNSHLAVEAVPYAFCVVCGLEATPAQKGCLVGTPCPGPRQLKSRHSMGLRAGLHDQAVLRARPAVQAAARVAGWLG